MFNLISGESIALPWVWMLLGGFSCVSKSPQSSKRTKFKSCVQEGQGETGVTFDYIFQYIMAVFPVLVILENLKELDYADHDQNLSTDAEYIIKQFNDIGYNCVVKMITSAANCGSRTARIRMFFICSLCQPDIADSPMKLGKDLLITMKTPCWPAKRFLDLSSYVRMMTEPGKRPSGGTKYMDEHLEISKACGFTWPPTIDEQHLVIDYMMMSKRQCEVVYIIHTHFQNDVDVQKCESRIQFCDVNNSLKRLVSWPNANGVAKSPWRDICPTFVAKSTIVMRQIEQGAVVLVRVLHGDELMNMIGWPEQATEDFRSKYEPALLTSLAGNAFNGFQMQAVISSALAVAGAVNQVKLDAQQLLQGFIVDPNDDDGNEDVSCKAEEESVESGSGSEAGSFST